MQGDPNPLKYTDIHNDVVASIVETGSNYYVALATALALTLICFFFPWFYQLYYGIGAAGMNHPSVWGTYLANFIFWKQTNFLLNILYSHSEYSYHRTLTCRNRFLHSFSSFV